MNAKQESQITMCMAVEGFVNDNKAALQGLPNIVDIKTILTESRQAVQAISVEQIALKKRVTADEKRIARNVLVFSLIDNVSRMSVFAKTDNNIAIAKIVEISNSEIKRFSDNELVDFGQLIYNTQTPILTNLATYGIDEEKRTLLQESVISFKAKIGSPKLKQAEQANITKALAEGIAKMKYNLNLLDDALRPLQETDVLLYEEYKSVRAIVYSPDSVALQGEVLDAATNKAIPFAQIVIAPKNGTKEDGTAIPAIVHKSAEKGGFRIQNLATDEYTITVTKIGYKKNVIEVVVNNDDTTEVTILMEKNS